MGSFIYVLLTLLLGLWDLASGGHVIPTCTLMGSPEIARVVIGLLIIVLIDMYFYLREGK